MPGTQKTPVLIGKGLVLEGSTPKTKDKLGSRCIYIYYVYMYVCNPKALSVLNQPTHDQMITDDPHLTVWAMPSLAGLNL